MDEININLIQLLKLNLNVNEYLTLLKLRYISENIQFPFISAQSHLDSLSAKGFLDVNGDSLILTAKGAKVFKTSSNIKISESDFEQFFDLYPSKTPSGRRLRSSAKSGGGYTRDFEVCYRKYSAVVKDLLMHESIMQATKNLIYDYRRRGSSEYMQNLETYINQRTWEKYLDMSPIEMAGENVEKI